MESFVQALGGVEQNARSFLHLKNFCKNFLVNGLRNVATLKKIPLGNIATLDSTSRR